MWTPPFDNGAPLVAYNLTVDGASQLIAHSDGYTPQYSLVDLWPNTQHVFTVAAVNAIGSGPASPAATFTTAKSFPGRPAPQAPPPEPV